jgi:ribonuclease D
MVSRGFARSDMARGLIAAVKRGIKRDPKSLPHIEWHEAPRARVGPIGDLLKVLLKMICDEEGVAQRIVATADELHRLAGSDKADVPALKGWRRELFGAAALKLKHGKIVLAIEGDRVAIVERDTTPRK